VIRHFHDSISNEERAEVLEENELFNCFSALTNQWCDLWCLFGFHIEAFMCGCVISECIGNNNHFSASYSKCSRESDSNGRISSYS
jgi:hypothetical protein